MTDPVEVDRIADFLSRKYIAPHLRFGEIACSCFRCRGSRGFLQSGIIDVWRLSRRELGAPGTIYRGWSCPAHNVDIGGSPISRHPAGLALDLKFRGWHNGDPELHRVLIKSGATGIVWSKRRLHVDSRPGKYFMGRYVEGRNGEIVRVEEDSDLRAMFLNMRANRIEEGAREPWGVE